MDWNLYVCIRHFHILRVAHRTHAQARMCCTYEETVWVWLSNAQTHHQRVAGSKRLSLSHSLSHTDTPIQARTLACTQQNTGTHTHTRTKSHRSRMHTQEFILRRTLRTKIFDWKIKERENAWDDRKINIKNTKQRMLLKWTYLRNEKKNLFEYNIEFSSKRSHVNVYFCESSSIALFLYLAFSSLLWFRCV